MKRAFYADAQAYCAFIDSWRVERVSAPFSSLLRLLSNLAKSGAVIPFDMAEAKVEDVERIDHTAWQKLSSEIAQALHDTYEGLFGEHANALEEQARAFMLWDDLSDIYRDLRHGLDLYAVGDPDHIAEAFWQWRWGYENHWGRHLFRALMTVHEIRYRLYME